MIPTNLQEEVTVKGKACSKGVQPEDSMKVELEALNYADSAITAESHHLRIQNSSHWSYYIWKEQQVMLFHGVWWKCYITSSRSIIVSCWRYHSIYLITHFITSYSNSAYTNVAQSCFVCLFEAITHPATNVFNVSFWIWKSTCYGFVQCWRTTA